MTRIYKIIAGTAGAIALAAATVVAIAHPGGGMGQGQGMGPGTTMGQGMGGMGGMGMMQGGMTGGGHAAMSEQGLAQLKAALKITAAQETPWQAFAGKASAQAAAMQATHAQHQQTATAETPAPDRMTQHLGTMAQHLAGMQAVNTAFKDLYAVLTPEQRSIADKQFGAMGGGRGGMGRGMHG